MDEYKKIFRSQALRMKILKALEWIPDKEMVKLQYWIKMGRKLNLKNPQRFTEKIQWYKLFYHTPLMTKCVDKHEVRNFLKSLGMSDYLIPELGVWDRAADIEWNVLPESFILKTTNGSESNIFVHSKSTANKKEICEKLNNWITQTKLNYGREWAYNGVKPRIIAEPIISSDDQHGQGLDDYKFFCFNGQVKMMWIDYDRFGIHKRVLYNPDGRPLNVRCTYISPEDFKYPKEEFETLLPIAKKLSEGFPHSRIDLYYVKRKPYFGEITFYSGSGYEPFDSDEYDLELGRNFILPSKTL